MAPHRDTVPILLTGMTAVFLVVGLLDTSANADDAAGAPVTTTEATPPSSSTEVEPEAEHDSATTETTTPSSSTEAEPEAVGTQTPPAKAPSTLRAVLRTNSITTQKNAVLDVEVTAEQSPDGGKVEVVVDGKTIHGTVVDGTATLIFMRLKAGTYDVVATYRGNAEVEASTGLHASLKVRAMPALTLVVNSGADTSFGAGETVWLRGKATYSSGRPYVRKFVRLYRYSGSTMRSMGRVRTNSAGGYSKILKPSVSTTYRAVISTLRSPKLNATKLTSARTLDSRELALGFLLGAPVTGRRAASSVVWRRYQRGVLAQAGSHTWLVRTSVLSKYLDKKGVGGALGAPIADQRCGLTESACLQRFEHGAIYVNAKAKRKAVAAIAPGHAAELVAVALSQVGYREPHPRKSKYNRWIRKTGSNDPWCGYFAAWASYASGHEGAVVSRKSFPAMVKAERARHRTTRKPAVGRLAYIDYFRNGKATHLGIVYKLNGSHVWTVEGNVSAGGGSKQPRGVHIVKRKRSKIVFYANPRY